MIRYFNGRIKLNTVEQHEIKELYNTGGRKIEVMLNPYDEPQVAVYTDSVDGEQNYKVADLFGSTAEALFHIVGVTDNPKYMWSLREIIDKYCY